MLTEGKEATAKCSMCAQVGKGVTFKVGFLSPHLCVACIQVVRDTLTRWLGKLTA